MVSCFPFPIFRFQDLRCDNSNDEGHPFQLTREMLTGSNGRIVDTRAAVNAAPGEDGNGNEASAKQDVEDKAEEGEDGDASEEESEDNGETSVNDSSA